MNSVAQSDAMNMAKFSQKCINCLRESGQNVNIKVASVLPAFSASSIHPGAGNFDHIQEMSVLHALSLVFQIADKEFDGIANCRLCNACSEVFVPLFQLFVQFNSLTATGSFINDLMCRNNIYKRFFGLKQEKEVILSEDDGDGDPQERSYECPKNFYFSGIDTEHVSKPHQQENQDGPNSMFGDSQVRKATTLQLSKELIIKLEPLDLDDMISDIESTYDNHNEVSPCINTNPLRPLSDIDTKPIVQRTTPKNKQIHTKSRASERISQISSARIPTTTATSEQEESQATFNCSKCCEYFNERNALEQHAELHIRATKYFCTTCKCFFKTLIPFQRHITKYHRTDQYGHAETPGFRSFKCKKCCETFISKHICKKHETASHVDHSKYFCPICPCYFKTPSTWRLHRFRAHPSVQIPGKSETYADLKCKLCSLPFLNVYTLNKHIIAKHYQCPVCDAQFSSDNEAKFHVSSQHGEDSLKHSFVCELCGYKTNVSLSLRRHKALVHLEGDSDSYDCKVCGKKCFDSSSLKIHSYVHSEDRAFKCDQCPMSFKRPKDLQVHSKIHAGIKYICDMCGHQSSNPANLRKHIQGVHFGQKIVQKRNPMEQKKKRFRLANAIKAVSTQEHIQIQNDQNDPVHANNETIWSNVK